MPAGVPPSPDRGGTPSTRNGMSPEAEARCLSQARDLLRVVAELLGLPPTAALVALAILHRFYERHPHNRESAEIVVPGCIFLASKLEECTRRVSDVVNATNRALYPRVGDPPHLIAARLRIDWSKKDTETVAQRGANGNLPPSGKGAPREDPEARERSVPVPVPVPVPGPEDAARAKMAFMLAERERLKREHPEYGPRRLHAACEARWAAAEANPARRDPDGKDLDDASGSADASAASKPGDTSVPGDAIPVPATEPRPPIVGEEYYSIKAHVLNLEQRALVACDYGLDFPQPHRALFSLCRSLGASTATTQLATTILTDAAFATDILTRCSSGEMAAAATRVAMLLRGEKATVRRDGSAAKVTTKAEALALDDEWTALDDEGAWTDGMPSWWEAMGFEHERIEAIGMEMFEVIEAGATRGNRRRAAKDRRMI